MEEAHSTGCQLVVYPELALTTFFPRHWRDSTAEIDQWFEREMPSTYTRPLFEEAVRLQMSFYLGYAELASEQGGARHYNTSILVGPDGKVVGKYRKVHLPGHRDFRPSYPFQQLEKRYFDVGDLGFPVWWHRDVIMGMAICNDRRWPETYRVMGLQDVELIMLGYNTHTVNQYHPEAKHLKMLHHHVVMQAGAYQNGTWIVATAKTGVEDGCELMGGTCIVAPTGEIVAHAVTQEDELITFKCDMDLGVQIKKNRFNFAEHRRIEHYRIITERAGAVAPEKP
jgi:predicted amidohydrolase